VIFLRRTGNGTTNVEQPPGFALDFASDFTLYSAELQHLWQTPRNTLIVGGRWQGGRVESDASLTRAPGAQRLTDDHIDEPLMRSSLYAYDHWQVAEPLRLIAGVSYDRVEFPRNSDLAPLTKGTDQRDLVSPKLGLVYAPWQRGLLRASYTRSLGGLFFDNSVRLEPTQVAGFNQAFRSLIPESVAGLVPGTRFETAGVGFDQSFQSGTYLGVEAEWLRSDGERTVGALRNSGLLPFPDTATSTRQTLDFRERSLSAYAVQLLGDQFSVGARYRLSEAKLRGRFPDLTGASGLDLLEQHETALLHRVGLTLNWQHASGFFGQWESLWLRQSNDGYTSARPAEDLWQHNLALGYRFPRRRAELRVGVLNLIDTDYRLNPLNFHASPPRHRTFVTSLRLNF
jgi:hypothetical protein